MENNKRKDGSSLSFKIFNMEESVSSPSQGIDFAKTNSFFYDKVKV